MLRSARIIRGNTWILREIIRALLLVFTSSATSHRSHLAILLGVVTLSVRTRCSFMVQRSAGQCTLFSEHALRHAPRSALRGQAGTGQAAGSRQQAAAPTSYPPRCLIHTAASWPGPGRKARLVRPGTQPQTRDPRGPRRPPPAPAPPRCPVSGGLPSAYPHQTGFGAAWWGSGLRASA